jgi:transcription elongation factor Elf1
MNIERAEAVLRSIFFPKGIDKSALMWYSKGTKKEEASAMYRFKCPNCGSTAQVRPVGLPTISRNGDYLLSRFSCGCGREFVLSALIAELDVYLD